jgi:putative ABC transport system substrate-binding protein
MRRRELIAFLGAAAWWPLTARGQQAADKAPLIGVLIAGSEASYRDNLDSFLAGMRQLGYTAGHNIRYEYWFADGDLDRLPGLAAELVRRDPQVIVSSPMPAHFAARRVTTTIPIVMASSADPVGFGLAESLSRPGGNLTGMANFAELLASKQLDFLRELMPHLSRIAVLVNPGNPLHAPQLAAIRDAARSAQAALLTFEIRHPGQLDEAFSAIAGARADALLVPPDTVFRTYRRRIADLAASAGLPTVYGYRDHVEAGGLISYGPNLNETYHRAATYVDKILKGAKPGELPIEQPTKIELVVNLKAARALRLTVPATLLARADEVIE